MTTDQDTKIDFPLDSVGIICHHIVDTLESVELSAFDPSEIRERGSLAVLAAMKSGLKLRHEDKALDYIGRLQSLPR